MQQHINTLPDLVLRLIFSKLSIRDVLNAGRVCQLWTSYRAKMVRSLTLLIGSSSLAHSLITDSCFTLKYRDLLLNDDDGTQRMYSSTSKLFHLNLALSQRRLLSLVDYANQLVHILPCITTLEIAIEYVHLSPIEFQHIISLVNLLLTKWSPTLRSLKLYIELEKHVKYTSRSRLLTDRMTKECNGKFVILLEVINSLSLLEHLTLSYNGLLFDSASFPNLSILGQLRELYIDSQDDSNQIEKFLKFDSVTSDNLKQIGLNLKHGILSRIYQKFPQLRDKVVYLSASYPWIRNIACDILPFTSLTLLQLRPDRKENIFTGSLNYIASLKQLAQLHLHFPRDYFRLFIPRNLELQVSREQIDQLSSIHVLILDGFKCHEYVKFAFKFRESTPNLWAYLFPKVQVIELNLDSSACDIELRKSLETFVQFPKLHHIYTSEIKISIVQPLNPVTDQHREWIVHQVGDRKIVS